MFAEKAVILADLIVDGKSHGGHLFWATIQVREGSSSPFKRLSSKKQPPRPSPVKGVTVASLPLKSAMWGLDNAEISFDNFEVSRVSLLARYGGLSDGVAPTYEPRLPSGTKRMLDILVSRLMTGRIVLSEATLSHSMSRVRHSWSYCLQRELWRGRKEKGPMMADMPLIRGAFRDYSRTAAIFQVHPHNIDKDPNELVCEIASSCSTMLTLLDAPPTRDPELRGHNA